MDESTRTLRTAGTALAVLALSLGVVNLAVLLATARHDLLLSPDVVLPLSASAVGGLIVRQVPRNPVGWLLLGMAISSALFGASALVVAAAPDGAVGPLAAWLSTWVWLPSYLLAFWFLPMLFPDGRAVTSWWRPVIWGSAALLVAECLLLGFGTEESIEPGVDNPFALAPVTSLLTAVEPVIFLGMMLLVAAGVLSLVVRLFRTRGQERVQVLCVLVAAAVGSGYYVLSQSGVLLGLLLPVAIAVAVLRFRLYDVERLLTRTIMYGGLATAAALIYVAVLLTATRVAGVVDDLRLQALVIVLAVLVIHPLRDRLMRLANRLVYGRRTDPYETLAALAQRVGSTVSPDETLPVMASAIAEALEADEVVVEAVTGEGVTSTSSTTGDGSTAEAGVRRVVEHHGEQVGAIEVRRPEPLTAREDALLDVLVAQAGPALSTVGLTAALREELARAVTTAAELRSSRARLVTAHDTARRAIERDLHDGAQQGLLAIAVELGRIQRGLGVDPADTMARIADLQDLARRTLVDLRTLAAGTYPPVLRELGPAAAVRERTEHLDVPVRVHDRLNHRLDPALESAIYFACMEAVTNAVKHADADSIDVALTTPAGGRVEMTVTDDGSGFDVDARSAGTGLAGMVDRLSVFDGGTTVESRAGEGTIVRGWAYEVEAERYSSTA